MSSLQGSEPWMPNGFPPPSFVVETERIRSGAGGGGTGIFAGRGRWLAAAAILGVLLLISGLLLLAGQDDGDDTALDAGSTTTVFADTAPEFTTPLDPTATLPTATTGPVGVFDPNAVAPGAGGAAPDTTAPPAAAAPPPAPGAPPGVLTPAVGTVTLPTMFTNRPDGSKAPPVSESLVLRNTGPSPLNFTSRAGTGITVDPPAGPIAPGGTSTVTIRFDGSGLAEGPYNGSIAFEGSGGSRTVQVKSTVARPPTITPAGDPKGTETSFVDAIPGKTACTADWILEAGVFDPAGVRSVTASISRNGGQAVESPMVQSADPRVWTLKQPKEAAPDTTMRITVRAIDKLGAETTATEDYACPAP